MVRSNRLVIVVGLLYLFSTITHIPLKVLNYVFDKNAPLQFIGLLATALALTVILLFKNSKVKVPLFIAMALGLLLVSLLISASLSPNFMGSLTGDTGRYTGVASLFALVIVALFHANLNRRQFKKLVGLYIFTFAVTLIVGILQSLHLIELPGIAVFNLTVESAAHTVRPCSDGGACAIGETGPGGGAVFYIASTQQSWGRYLEAAPKTWNAGTEDPLLAWCNTKGSWVGGTASRQTQDIFGAGPANTALMISGCTSGAGVSVGSYNSSGRSPVSDWYLPTLVESNELCKFAYNVSDNNPAIACTTAFGGGVRTLRSDFLAAIYYTSYEESENYARYRRLDVNNVGGVAGHLKTDSLRVRPIRAF